MATELDPRMHEDGVISLGEMSSIVVGDHAIPYALQNLGRSVLREAGQFIELEGKGHR